MRKKKSQNEILNPPLILNMKHMRFPCLIEFPSFQFMCYQFPDIGLNQEEEVLLKN